MSSRTSSLRQLLSKENFMISKMKFLLYSAPPSPTSTKKLSINTDNSDFFELANYLVDEKWID
jgi:hypothetical protein